MPRWVLMSEPKTDNIIEALKKAGGCAYPFELANELRADPNMVALVLLQLARQGLVYRDETTTIDYTKPLLTSKWCITSKPAQAPTQPEAPKMLGEVVDLVLSTRLYKDLDGWLTGKDFPGLIDALKAYICGARREIKIAMPYIGDFLGLLLQECADKLRNVKIRVMTESESAGDVEPLKAYLPMLQAVYATDYSRAADKPIKVRGIHAKFVVIDDELAIVGTFNLTKYHLFVNYDIGLVVRGPIVKYLSDIFDYLWDYLNKK
jgi:phosphatidylserine/phosphatidylglycerophosphate/cardiolipin synthase-like enzyme